MNKTTEVNCLLIALHQGADDKSMISTGDIKLGNLVKVRMPGFQNCCFSLSVLCSLEMSLS